MRKLAVIAIDFTSDLEKSLSKLTRIINLQEFELHLVHIIPEQSYESNTTPYIYPHIDERDYLRIQVINSLKNIKNKYFNFLKDNQSDYKCIFSYDAHAAFCDYVARTNADVAILPTRSNDENTVRDSAFAHYLCSHCNASLLIVR